jgi:uncharacterized protein YsxB (DUF464 family)
LIKVKFTKNKNGEYIKLTVEGHSGYAEEGSDIVCAAVSSAVQLSLNLITENYGENLKIIVKPENAFISAEIINPLLTNANTVFTGLFQHISVLSEEFGEWLEVAEEKK